MDVLDKIKALSLLPDGVHVTTEMVAAYYEVGVEAIKSLVKDNRSELEDNGYATLSGEELRSFKDLSGISSRARELALFPRRAVLNVGQLLTESPIARAVRTYLLDVEEAVRTEQAESAEQPPAPAELDELEVAPHRPRGVPSMGMRTLWTTTAAGVMLVDSFMGRTSWGLVKAPDPVFAAPTGVVTL